MKLHELGEKRLISHIIENVLKPRGLHYVKNDVHYLRFDDVILAVSIDGFCESTWMLPFLTWYDVGVKAAKAALSDLIVKLSRPLSISISLVFTRGHDVEQVEQVIRGVLDVCSKFNVELLKLDTNEGKEFSIHICVLGLARREIGLIAEPGTKIYTIPRFGYTGIVFKLLSESRLDEAVRDPVVREGIEILRNTQLDVWVNVLNMVDELEPHLVASTDTSDGLGAALWTIAEVSNCVIKVDTLPTTRDVLEFCKQYGLDPVEIVFNGAEDYLPVFIAKSLPSQVIEELGLVEIGEVVEKGRSLVLYREEVLKYRGWEYFKY